MDARRGTATIGTAFVLTLALGGCADPEAEPEPGERHTNGTASKRVDPGEFAEQLAAGLASGTTAHLEQRIDMPVAHLEMHGAAHYTHLPADLTGSLDLDVWRQRHEKWTSQTLEARVVDGTTYLGSRGRFVAFDADTIESLEQGLVEFVGQISVPDPDRVREAPPPTTITG